MDHVLTGLAGENPLGFLAALGVLRVLHEHAKKTKGAEPTLCWEQKDAWRPTVAFDGPFEEMCGVLDTDRRMMLDTVLPGLRYLKVEKRASRLVGAAKPPLAVFRAWTQSTHRDQLDFIAGLSTDGVPTEPPEGKLADAQAMRDARIAFDERYPLNLQASNCHLDFTNRNQQFIQQAESVGEVLDEAELTRCLIDPAGHETAERSMGWDAGGAASAALYGRSARRFAPGPEWFAFRALPTLTLFPTDRRIPGAIACRGERLNGTFIWPLWTVRASQHTIRSLLATPLERTSQRDREGRGVAVVLTAALTKLGKYDAIFGPAGPA